MDFDWSNPEDYSPERGVEDRLEGKGNLRIALALYHVGGGTVESLTEDWGLSPEESAEMMRLVKKGWKEGVWVDHRRGKGRRAED